MANLKVETLSRLARWRIDSYGDSSCLNSDPFKMGIWNWRLKVEIRERGPGRLYVRLLPEALDFWEEQTPFARFVVSVSIPFSSQKRFTSRVKKMQFRAGEVFSWHVGCCSEHPNIIDVEFLDLKICPPNDGEVSAIESQDGEDALLWPGDGSRTMQLVVPQSPLRYLPQMFEETIHSDLIINISDGSLKAHKLILCACSPVFQSMFHHNLKEKESSTIYIKDMSLESCRVLLNYLYGNIKLVDFWKHRFALLSAANKYGIVDLKDACEESLLEDISLSNVLERLQKALLYQLDKLKKGCMMFLFEFGKAYEIRGEMNNFFGQLDRESMFEMLQMVVGGQETSMRASGLM